MLACNGRLSLMPVYTSDGSQPLDWVCVVAILSVDRDQPNTSYRLKRSASRSPPLLPLSGGLLLIIIHNKTTHTNETTENILKKRLYYIGSRHNAMPSFEWRCMQQGSWQLNTKPRTNQYATTDYHAAVCWPRWMGTCICRLCKKLILVCRKKTGSPILAFLFREMHAALIPHHCRHPCEFVLFKR